MAGSITVSSITLDSDNNFSIKSNTGATLFFANTTGIDIANSIGATAITNDKILSVANTKISGNIVSSQIAPNQTLNGNVSVTGTLSATGAVSGTTGTFTSTLGVTGAITGSSTVAGSTGILYPLTSGTAVASTSGTSIDFTGIPSWVKRITVMFNGVSLSGTANPYIQLGDSGGIEASGYSQGTFSSALGTTGFSSAFVIYSATAAYAISGTITISLLDGATNLWVATGTFGSGSGIAWFLGGAKSTSATLDRVRITTSNGTDTFDAGSVNILYE